MFDKIEMIAVVGVIIMVLFGSKKIPELAKNLGSSIKEVKKGFNGESDES